VVGKTPHKQLARGDGSCRPGARGRSGPGVARAGPAAGRMERSAARGSGAAAAAEAAARRSLTPTPARGRCAAPP
jgi:hypothetical protein